MNINWLPETKSCLQPDMPTPPTVQPTALENVIADEIRTARIEAIEAMPAVERRVFCKLLEFLSQPDDEISRGGTLTKKESLMIYWYRSLDDDEKAVAMRFLDQLDGSYTEGEQSYE